MSVPRILCAMPTRGTPHPQAFAALMTAAGAAGARWITPAGCPRDWNRNKAVAAFLQDADQPEWLLFVDDDTVIPPDAIAQLLAVGQPVVSGVQPLFMLGRLIVNVSPGCPGVPPCEPVEWEWWHQFRTDAAPFRIGSCGFGCVLIHRSVLVDIGPPWFVEYYGDARGAGAQTEDMHFCRRVAECGYELWCQPTVSCGHLKAVDLRQFVELSCVHVPNVCPPSPVAPGSLSQAPAPRPAAETP